MTIHLTLPVPPSANRYWRHERNMIHRSSEAKAYIAQVAWLCKEQGIVPLDGNVCVSVDVYRPAKRGDLDNYAKILLDSLCGYAYHDDAQIVEIHAGRYDDKANPRIEVQVEQVSA
jgi:crossover junction endodeoxyribonuclease RusA